MVANIVAAARIYVEWHCQKLNSRKVTLVPWLIKAIDCILCGKGIQSWQKGSNIETFI